VKLLPQQSDLQGSSSHNNHSFSEDEIVVGGASLKV